MKKSLFCCLMFVMFLFLILPTTTMAVSCKNWTDGKVCSCPVTPATLKGNVCVTDYDPQEYWGVDYCTVGTEVIVNGKKRCQDTREPTLVAGINCSGRSDNKVCTCPDGPYTLEGDLCVADYDPQEYYGIDYCNQKGTEAVTVEGKTRCQGTVKPTLEIGIITNYNFCDQEGVLKAFKVVGYLLFIIKILVPLLLIIFGAIDFGQAVIASDETAIQKAARMLVIRLAAGVIIFFIPTVINTAMGLVSSWQKVDSAFGKCTECLFEPSDCPVSMGS